MLQRLKIKLKELNMLQKIEAESLSEEEKQEKDKRIKNSLRTNLDVIKQQRDSIINIELNDIKIKLSEVVINNCVFDINKDIFEIDLIRKNKNHIVFFDYSYSYIIIIFKIIRYFQKNCFCNNDKLIIKLDRSLDELVLEQVASKFFINYHDVYNSLEIRNVEYD